MTVNKNMAEEISHLESGINKRKKFTQISKIQDLFKIVADEKVILEGVVVDTKYPNITVSDETGRIPLRIIDEESPEYDKLANLKRNDIVRVIGTYKSEHISINVIC